MLFGKMLKEAREKCGLRQEDIVEIFNEASGDVQITKSSLSNYERGNVLPQIHVACKLIKMYDLDPSEVCSIYSDGFMPHIMPKPGNQPSDITFTNKTGNRG